MDSGSINLKVNGKDLPEIQKGVKAILKKKLNLQLVSSSLVEITTGGEGDSPLFLINDKEVLQKKELKLRIVKSLQELIGGPINKVSILHSKNPSPERKNNQQLETPGKIVFRAGPVKITVSPDQLNQLNNL